MRLDDGPSSPRRGGTSLDTEGCFDDGVRWRRGALDIASGNATSWPTEPRTPKPGRVSVVVPAYNGEAFLASCIESMRNQGLDDLEIIVVDDGSTDDTLQIARSLPVRVVTQTNGGVSVARNRGFVECTGEFVVFQDQDDRSAAEALERGREILRKNPACGMVFGRTRIIDEHDVAGNESSIRKAPATVDAFLEGKVIVPPGVAMFRHQSVVSAGPFDPAWQIVGDLAFYVSVMKVADAVFHDEVSVEYRRHSDNVSSRGSEAETLHELLAYLGREREKTQDPERLKAIEIGRRYWTRRFWRSAVTWSVRCCLGGRLREACFGFGVALRTFRLRFFGGDGRERRSPEEP